MAPTIDDPRTDVELARAIRRGRKAERRASFDLLAARHQPWLARLLFSLLGSEAEAEDALQETLVRAFLASKKIPVGGGLRAWLRTIATRTAFNCRRASRTRQRYADEYARSAEPAVEAEPGVISREVLQRVLGRMNYPMREVLVLRYVEELSVPEIAEQLELGLSAAKMRLSRAREEFLELYGTIVRPAQPERKS